MKLTGKEIKELKHVLYIYSECLEDNGHKETQLIEFYPGFEEMSKDVEKYDELLNLRLASKAITTKTSDKGVSHQVEYKYVAEDLKEYCTYCRQEKYLKQFENAQIEEHIEYIDELGNCYPF